MAIVIEAEQTMAAATALREALLAALVPAADVVLDIGGVTCVDFAVLQVVEAARRQADVVGAGLALAAPAPATLRAVLGDAGFLSHAASAPAAHARAEFWTHGDLPA